MREFTSAYFEMLWRGLAHERLVPSSIRYASQSIGQPSREEVSLSDDVAFMGILGRTDIPVCPFFSGTRATCFGPSCWMGPTVVRVPPNRLRREVQTGMSALPMHCHITSYGTTCRAPHHHRRGASLITRSVSRAMRSSSFVGMTYAFMRESSVLISPV